MKAQNVRLIFGLFLISTLLVSCKAKDQTLATSYSADESASGAAASALGGALSGSSASGTQAYLQMKSVPTIWETISHAAVPSAYAAGFCPTFATTASGCSASGSSMWLTYSNCNFGGEAAWNGVQKITRSSGTASCGSFPNPGANGTLYRQFVSASGSNTPASTTIEADGYLMTVDHSSSNLNNFDGQTIPAIQNGGYGLAVSFNASGARSSVTLGHRTTVNGFFDHSVTGTLTVNEAASTSTSRSVSGTVTVYHNLARVVGTSTFSNVVHQNICCVPTAGTITTVFSAGNNVTPTILGSAFVGKTETLEFTGCGTAKWTDHKGTVKNVKLNRCF